MNEWERLVKKGISVVDCHLSTKVTTLPSHAKVPGQKPDFLVGVGQIPNYRELR